MGSRLPLKVLKTQHGHDYYTTRQNFPPSFDDNIKDEILNRMAHHFSRLNQLARTGCAMSGGEIGTVMLSLCGLFSDNMEAMYVCKSKMDGPLSVIAPLIDQGDWEIGKQLHVSLFYDHMFQSCFHPNSDVGMFLLEPS